MKCIGWSLTCVLLVLLGLSGCADKDEADGNQVTTLPDPEPVVLELIHPAPEAFGSAEPNQIVFDMAYQGLSGSDDPLFFQYGYGYGGNMEETSFVKDLKRYGIKDFQLIYNFECTGFEISALELEEGKAVAFYIDLDANGKVTANERLAPLPPDPENERTTTFLTPDFSFTNRDEQRICSRLMIRAGKYQGQDEFNCTWFSACVLVGQAQWGNQPVRLVLYPAAPAGDFDRFSRSNVSIQIGSDQMAKRPSRSDLSRLCVVEDRFYRLSMQRPADDGAALRVIMSEDTSPTGQVQAALQLKDNASGKIRYARVTGESPDDNISLALPTSSMTLPVGRYRLDRGGLRFGVDEEDEWEVDMSEGPLFTVEAGKETAISLGNPKLSLSAIDNKRRYYADVESQTTFAVGTAIYLNREITGSAGESYGRFYTVNDEGRRQDVKAHLAIKDPGGKEILSQDLEYG